LTTPARWLHDVTGSIAEFAMPVNLSVKNVPDALAERLRERAAANHRSLQRELVFILEQAVSLGAAERRAPMHPEAGRRSIEDVVGELREIFPQPRLGGASSVDLIRQMRDARHGDAQPAGGTGRRSRLR
jgi:plasmid stability protein